ncbi:MAG TPA: tripartite tricarboxylate transporter substrate binding protein [Chloroflexota bacterium]|jgi:tripartite-type tricarboxylate transporter receptor subunit TctC|nr:tripartite tricarboxylate transporter substrate binding protein [Chloroflexota bacterium]
MAHRALLGVLSVAAILVLACTPAAPSPTAQPSPKPAASTAPAPAGSPAAAAASPAASPAAAASAPASVAAVPKPANGFPTRPLEIVLPFPPGGGFDALARQISIPLQKELGQPIAIKNVPGSGQRLGARQFQSSAPDGYTLGYFSDTQLFVSNLVEDPQGIDLSKWSWVAGLRYHSPSVIVVGRDAPFKSVADIIAADKAGQKIRMGHNGLGGFLSTHAVVANALGLQNVVHVGGFNGTGDIMPSMARGDLDMFINAGVSSALPFIQSGDVRPLAVLWPQDGRSPLLPDVPNARELGLPNQADVEGVGAMRSGFAAPPGTPADVLAVLEQATLNATKDPTFLEWTKSSGFESELSPLPASEFRERKQREFEFWSKQEPVLKKVAQ